jgi:hypothetical protein
MKRWALLLALVALVAVLAGPATAAKKAARSGTSDIWIASDNGTTFAAASTMPAPKLGDAVNFGTVVEPLAGWEYAMVVLSCYQDVNGDGTVDTDLLGPDVVFTWLDRPDATFTVGGYSSIWTQRGGDAICRADLDAYGWKGGKESIRLLDLTPNWVAAS